MTIPVHRHCEEHQRRGNPCLGRHCERSEAIHESKQPGLPRYVRNDGAAGMRPHRVEVAQNTDAPGGVAAVHVTQHVFYHQLGLAIGVGS